MKGEGEIEGEKEGEWRNRVEKGKTRAEGTQRKRERDNKARERTKVGN